MSKRMVQGGVSVSHLDGDSWFTEISEEPSNKCSRTEEPMVKASVAETPEQILQLKQSATNGETADDKTAINRKRRTAELEASQLLELLIPEEGWENSVRAVASVVDEIYAANFEQQQHQHEAEESVDADDIFDEIYKERSFNLDTCNGDKTLLDNTTVENVGVKHKSRRGRRHASSVRKHRSRQSKTYGNMASTLKIPLPILPNGTAPGSNAAKPLQYHQYQPATPLVSGTCSAK